MITRAEKTRQTIIAKYGSWEAFLEQRYRNPKHAAKRSEAASKAGKAAQSKPNANRPFDNKEKAREAQRKSVEARRAKDS